MTPSSADLLSAAALAECIATELASAADALATKGKRQAVRVLLEEARRHTVEAIRLRAQARLLQEQGDTKSESPDQSDKSDRATRN
ncbi:hypothetical protein [Methylobacterium nigriterrae]|uniref:hypothetical protein n=1 Tax=Methylobacterium nigriterrae TaxID=3127512 RepID=UPI0030136CD3